MPDDAHLRPATGAPRFGVGLAGAPSVFSTGLPVLHGLPVERIFGDATPAGSCGPFTLFRLGRWLLGAASAPSTSGLEAAAMAAYQAMFAAVRGAHLVRVWNYVPAINESGAEGLEHYRAFNHGRSRAFEAEFGSDFRQAAPAASAVGTDAANLAVFFAASLSRPCHVENPRQVPSYQYPPEHGPRPPTFARATVVAADSDRVDIFISGTASIQGHSTVAPGDTSRQLSCTLENLREISVACGSGSDLARGQSTARHFKVYLRQAADLAEVQAALERTLLTPSDRVSYLRSDICRRALNVEIEATLMGVDLRR